MKTRFTKSILSGASVSGVELPWVRGKRRQAFIKKRTEHQKLSRQSA